jgi:hypothetical protein
METICRYRLTCIAAVAAGLILGACTGATLNSGVGDSFPEQAPFYAGVGMVGDTQKIVRLPVSYQRGATQSPIFDPEGGPDTPIARLLADMNAYLDSLGWTPALPSATAFRGTPPNVMFDCSTDNVSDCERSNNSGRMRLAIGRPSKDWIADASAALTAANAGRLVLITLEGANYWVQQVNWRGSKEIELGTRYSVPVPWLTSLDDPVSVLQLTGAVVGPDGKAIRIGAEGLLARRTSLILSAINAQTLITDEDVENLRTLRREDLPGKPLVWQVAMQNLLAQLTGKPELLYR